MDIGFLLFLGLQALSLGLDRGSYSLVGGLAASALISYSANKVYRGAGQYSFMGLWPLASYGIYKYSQKINELLEESNSILTPLNYELLQEIGLIDSHGASLLDQHKINPLPEIPIIAGEKNDISLLFLHLAVNWSMEFRYISAKDISDPEILKLSPTVFALDKHEASALSQEDIVKFYNSCQDKHRLLIMAENDGSPVQSSYIKIHKPHVFNQSLVLQALLKNYNHKYINKKLFLKQTKDLNFLKFYHLILSVKRYALRDGTNIIYPHYIEQALSVQDDKLSTIGSYNQDNIKEWLSDIALNHHHNRNIQHGILIHGPLSTDKVSLSLEIAAGLDFDTYLLDMNRYLSYFYKNDFSSVNNYFNTLREAAERDSSINHILILNGLDNLVNLRISDNEVAIIELLAQLNILSGYKNIFIIGIAGSFERIDPRILDLSYFKHTIQVSLPNQAEREVIFNNYIKAHDQLDRDSSISTLASMTNGWSGKAIIEMLDETI
ncbi:MAG TPA: ATP-binding protein, partial [Candidatus Babeliaceae bacterium]|nr:ATP-binding protein [Candidatus Babeliaceae bacterium]